MTLRTTAAGAISPEDASFPAAGRYDTTADPTSATRAAGIPSIPCGDSVLQSPPFHRGATGVGKSRKYKAPSLLCLRGPGRGHREPLTSCTLTASTAAPYGAPPVRPKAQPCGSTRDHGRFGASRRSARPGMRPGCPQMRSTSEPVKVNRAPGRSPAKIRQRMPRGNMRDFVACSPFWTGKDRTTLRPDTGGIPRTPSA